MRYLLLACFLLCTLAVQGQQFDYYGPAPFGEILDQPFSQSSWTPETIPSIENRKYVVLLDAGMNNAIVLDGNDQSKLALSGIDAGNLLASYGSVMRGIFQMVDINTHEDNNTVALAGEYRLNPFLHSYFALNASAGNAANITDGGTRYISEESETGYVLVTFAGTPAATTLSAVGQWTYDAGSDALTENGAWTTMWLKNDGTNITWTATEGEASTFVLADATDLIALEIADGSDFDPLSVAYQPNATAALPDVNPIEDSPVINDLDMELDAAYLDQLGNTAAATTAASAMLDEIETTLSEAGASLRYPKEFYLAVRENMLSQVIASSDVYNGRPGYQTVGHVYFTNAKDDDGVPHPFMVMSTHASSTRPNQLVDVSRPPGAEQGVGYGESTVTRNGKLGEFLVKVPLKDYGLISSLLDNDLSPYGDLASDFDEKMGSTTEKDVYNYAGLASVGLAIDGVTIYPAQNNNLRFAVEDGEVTHSGIHVGGGLELHYHADGHAFSGNGIALYNLADYEGHDHPPVIGLVYDGIALFGRYEDSYSAMTGYGIALDEYGGHDHGDDFGYHYHAHTQNVESNGQPGTFFDEHFLLVGAWKGDINNIPGFDEGKFNQFRDDAIARYLGATYTDGNTGGGDGGGGGDGVTGLSEVIKAGIRVYPVPSAGDVFIESQEAVSIRIFNSLGELVRSAQIGQEGRLSISNLPEGVYLLDINKGGESLRTRFVIEQ